MKFGKIIKVNLKDFEDFHLDPKCDGKFKLGFSINGFYDGTALGPIRVPCVPMAECSKCQAAHYIEEFTEFLDYQIAEHLISSKGLLIKKQIKFLRQFFNFTQEKLGKFLDTDKFEISKFESLKSSKVMQPEKQIIMKLKFAQLLEIKKAEILYEILDSPDKKIEIQENWFPKEEDVKKLVKAMA